MKIHVSPTYQVTYGDGNLSCMQTEVNNLLADHCRGIHYDGDSIDCAERLEVPREELIALLYHIAKDKPAFAKWLDRCPSTCTVEEFINIVSDWIAKSDPRNDYVVLTWF